MSAERGGGAGPGCGGEGLSAGGRRPLPEVVLGERFEAALALAAELHRRQRRKGSGTPYVAHLLGVASLVLEAWGDEDQAIAALLHDAVEDQGGVPTLALIRERFGPRVADMVETLSDAVGTPKPPWLERKRLSLARLWEASEETLLVAAADKLYNAEALLRDYRSTGEDLWKRFRASREQKLWYYGELAVLFQERLPGWMTDRYTEAVRLLSIEVGVEPRAEPIEAPSAEPSGD